MSKKHAITSDAPTLTILRDDVPEPMYAGRWDNIHWSLTINIPARSLLTATDRETAAIELRAIAARRIDQFLLSVEVR